MFGPPPTFQQGAAYVYRMDMENHDLVLEATLVSAEEGVVSQGLALALMEHGALVSAPASNAGTGAVNLTGWMVFEVPRGSGFREFRWSAADSITVRFN